MAICLPPLGTQIIFSSSATKRDKNFDTKQLDALPIIAAFCTNCKLSTAKAVSMYLVCLFMSVNTTKLKWLVLLKTKRKEYK